MKILILPSIIDLKQGLGCTPFWWQLYKALYENENELVVVPYLGRAVESPWWETYENPCLKESLLMKKLTDRKMEKRVKKEKQGKDVKKEGVFPEKLVQKLTSLYTVPKWKKKIKEINKEEDGFDACLTTNPLNQFEEVTEFIKDLMDIPVVYYEGDLPTILPKYALERGFRFNHFKNADLSLYDAFLVNSEGVIPDLKEMGAKNIHPFHYAVDPDLVYPVDVEKENDVAYFGYGSQYREKWMKKMITEPSKKMNGINFVVGGGHFGIDLGQAEFVGNVPYPKYKYFVGRSKINLNITRKSHASVYKTSTGRIFELPAMGAVMVSQPYNGLDEFFEPGKDYIQVDEEEDIVQIYRDLLSNENWRSEIAKNAREKILKDHSYEIRAKQLDNILYDCTKIN